jgi:hypothetical protein
VCECKKDTKLEDLEVMELLNENLRGKISAYLDGQILRQIKVLQKFDLDILIYLTTFFRSEVYSIGETVINEGLIDQNIFFIIAGQVSLIHQSSKSFICDLKVFNSRKI